MSRSAVFISTALLALSVSAIPHVRVEEANHQISLSFAININVSSSTLPEIDRARARHLFSRVSDGTAEVSSLERRASSFSVTNAAIAYTTNVGIGNPATSYNLLIDTGSSNTWVGAGKSYTRTSTSISTGQPISANYGSGSFSGTEYLDFVSLSSSLTITNQSIGSAMESTGFAAGVDGLLGLGPTILTEGTLVNQPNSKIPTVSDNLLKQKKISSEIIGISFNPTTSISNTNGELTFGGVDSSKYTGSITYAPITSTSPSKYYWGIEQSISYGLSGTVILSNTAGIVDTGTTLTLISSDAFTRYQTATGAVMDSATGLLRLNAAQYANLQSLFFTISGTKFELTANAQIWPRSLNQYIGGTSNSIYLIIGSTGQAGGSGMDFYNGFTFLERFYSVFDTTNNRVGFAVTQNTAATSN